MGKFQDLTGKRFGKLTVIERAPNSKNRVVWLCECDCGNRKEITAYNLVHGFTKSCGCAPKKKRHIPKDLTGQKRNMLTVLEHLGKNESGNQVLLCKCDCGKETKVLKDNFLRGHTKSCGCAHGEMHPNRIDRLYKNVYKAIIQRCYDPNSKGYKNYGGRGIRMCDEWKNSYNAFQKWALSNGYDPDAPRGECTIDRIDVNGDYEPSNCRWVDMRVQLANQRPFKRKGGGRHPVCRIDENGNRKYYQTIADACRDMGRKPALSSIGACCRGELKTAYGYRWEYANAE